MASLAGKAAARDDVYELVRLSWAYGGTDKEPEIDQALQVVASRLREREKLEELAYMLNLPAQRGVSRAVNVSVDELIAAGAKVKTLVLRVAMVGSREAKLRAARVLDGIGEAAAAEELRQRMAPPEQPWRPPGVPVGQVPVGHVPGMIPSRVPGMIPSQVPGMIPSQVPPPAVSYAYPKGSQASAIASFVVSLATFLVLPRISSAFWAGGFTWSSAIGAGVSGRAVTAGVICLVLAIPGPFVYGRVRRNYAHRPGRGLATAAFVVSIVCVAQLLIGLLLGDLLLPHVLGPTLAPVGPF